MQVQFNFEINDWMAFQEYHLSQSKQFKKTKLISTLIVPIVYGFFIINDLLKGHVDVILTSIFTIVSVLWLLFYPKRLTVRTLKKVRKILEDPANSNVLGTHTIVFDNEGINLTKPTMQNFINWEGIIKVEQTDAYIFIYNTTVTAIILPKNKIINQLNELNHLLEEKFPIQS
ncbi:MAG: YcxB family protein [Flavobacteriia bacterium]|nr:YcxB family protein [Flavobacteriia bacterium]